MVVNNTMKVYLKILGGFFIFCGVMVSTMGIIFYIFLTSIFIHRIPKEGLKKLLSNWRFFWMRNIGLTCVIIVFLGIVIIYSGISFLRKKRWARAVFEVISWIYLAEIVIILFLGLRSLFFTNYKNPYTPEYVQKDIKIIQTIILFLYAFIYGGITSLILYVLRRKEFKELFHKKVKE